MSRLKLLVATPAALLAACAGRQTPPPQPILTPVEVAVPVATGCVPANLAAAPEYPDTDQALRTAPDAASRYQLLYAGRKVRVARNNELEPIVAGCPRAVPVQPR